jgi:putative Mn2+ efflux pump MntP
MVPFSVALSSSVYRCIEWKETVKISLIFAIAHALMALMGWAIGYSIKGLFYDMKFPVALMIMLFIAFRLFMDSRRKNRQLRIVIDDETRLQLSFGLVTSINTALLSIGIGMLYTGLLPLTGIVFGGVFIFSILGVRIGKLGVMNLGWIAELVGASGLFIVTVILLLQYLKMI